MGTSCKEGGLFSKKHDKSGATGWNYNDKNQGGFNVAKAKDIKAGPGLVFVQGGTFVMGATEEDVMADWNNVPKRITVTPSLSTVPRLPTFITGNTSFG